MAYDLRRHYPGDPNCPHCKRIAERGAAGASDVVEYSLRTQLRAITEQRDEAVGDIARLRAMRLNVQIARQRADHPTAALLNFILEWMDDTAHWGEREVGGDATSA